MSPADPTPASADDQPPAAASPEAQQPSDAPVDDTKRRFQEALARKQNRHGEAHLGSGGHGPQGTAGPAKSQRTFRRKSG